MNRRRLIPSVLTIKSKIILAFTVIFCVMIGMFAWVIYRGVSDAEMTKLDSRLESHADKVSTEIEEQSDARIFPDVAQLLDLRTEGLVGVHIQIIDRNGNIIVPNSLLNGTVSGDWRKAFTGEVQKDILTIYGHSFRRFWFPCEVNNQNLYVAEIVAPMSEMEKSLERLQVLFLISIPLALALTLLSTYLITRIAFRPLTGMVETARQISAKNLHQRLVVPKTKDEVHLLGDTLNQMIGRIDDSFNSQKQFIADASHEIRTPLTVISTELEYAEQRIEDPAIKEGLKTALAETDRLANLARGLLLLAKLDALQIQLTLQQVRLDELLIECVQRLRSASEKKHIQVNVEVQEAIECVADKEKLESIILNLLDNAVKYSPPNTTVLASILFKEGTKDSYLITIADQGPGIPVSALSNIFKRFYRVDSARSDTPGIGLGLAIVERLVELHGGTVSVQSEEGKGSSFIVELPVTAKL